MSRPDRQAAFADFTTPFTAGFTGLQMTFEYPDILRHPVGEVLTRFAAAGADLHLYWYVRMVASRLMIGAVVTTCRNQMPARKRTAT